MQLRCYETPDETEVIALWQACDLVKPQNDPVRDIERKLSVNPDGFLVGTLQGQIVASIMVGYDGHRGWVNYLAVSPSRRRAGLGKILMQAAEQYLLARGCPKLNLQVRESNADVIAFYRALGYQTDPVTSLGRRLIPD
jgi:ribosomal protein S18 acetylase RimI-like enzyme